MCQPIWPIVANGSVVSGPRREIRMLHLHDSAALRICVSAMHAVDKRSGDFYLILLISKCEKC